MRFQIAVGICATLLLAATASATDVRDIVGAAHYAGRYWCPSNPQCAALRWAGDSYGSPNPNNIYPLNADGSRDWSNYTHDQLRDGADDILNLGSRVIYLKFNSAAASFYPYTWPHDVTVTATHAAAGCTPGLAAAWWLWPRRRRISASGRRASPPMSSPSARTSASSTAATRRIIPVTAPGLVSATIQEPAGARSSMA